LGFATSRREIQFQNHAKGVNSFVAWGLQPQEEKPKKYNMHHKVVDRLIAHEYKHKQASTIHT